MGLNILNGLSSDDLERQRQVQDPPSHDPGFGGVTPVGFSGFDDDDDDNPFSSLDDDDDDMFSGSGFGGGSGFDNPFGGFSSSNSMDSFGGFGGSSSLGNPFGNSYSSLGQQEKKEENKANDMFMDTMKDINSFIVDIIHSFKNRNIDDWASLSSTWITIGGVMSGIGLVSTILGTIGNLPILKLGSLGGSSLFGGILVAGGGFCGLGINAYLKAKGGQYAITGGNLEEVKEVQNTKTHSLEKSPEEDEDEMNFGFEDNNEDDTEEEEEDVSSLIAELFSAPSNDEQESFPIKEEIEEEEEKVEVKQVEYKALLSKVNNDVPFVNRAYLFDTFKEYFPLNSIGFANIKEYDMNDDLTVAMGAKINRAIEQLLPDKPPELREVTIESVRETHFAYEVIFSRVKAKGFKVENLEKEMYNYFRESNKDDSISITLDTLGDSYIAIITKGGSDAVTVGDCLTKPDVIDYIKNTKHALPFISGITDLGEVQMSDMRDYLTLAITGKPRSGKSWYVNSILTTLVAFNTPEEIQFIVVDPKKTSLFNTFSLLPHVCGLHDGTEILSIFKDIMESEAERRKKLFADADVDNIWEYKQETGVQLPVIMIVIDEIVTIYEELKEKNLNKEFSGYLKRILTQLPAYGIGLMMIPHRTTGILEPLTRMNLSYKATVMGDADAIKEEIGESKWKRPLTLPGDMAIKASRWKSAMYLKGTGLALTDKDTRKLLKELAKAWYKLGVDMPDMSLVGYGNNRDEKQIRDTLQLDETSKRIQYDTLNLDD